MIASLRLDTHFNRGVIDPRIFGGFLEHLGRAVYGGVYDPQSPHADRQTGFRLDVIDALKRLRTPAIRYPGGTYVSACDWKDGVGPRESRPRRPDFAWQSIETNQFGVNEFVLWCRQLGTEPMMAVNLGTGGAAEAAQLVEYCNLPGGTLWSDRRRDHGFDQPHAIRLWCLGNEMDGPWQAGHVPAEVYAHRAFAASVLMKGIDPGIKTVACGSSGRGMSTYLEWDRVVLEYCWDKVDFISAHRYSTNERNDTPWFLAEGVEIDQILSDYDGLIRYVGGRKRRPRDVFVSFDEWNVWYRARGGSQEQGGWQVAPPLLEEQYNFEDALVAAQYLMAFVRRADLVKVACLAQIVNVIAPIMTRTGGLLLQTIFHPIEMIAAAARGISLQTSLKSPVYRAGPRGDVPAIDVAATHDPAAGEVAVFAVNRDQSGPVTLSVEIADMTMTSLTHAAQLAGHHPKTANTWESPAAVAPTPADATLQGNQLRIGLPGPGFVAVRVAVRRR